MNYLNHTMTPIEFMIRKLVAEKKAREEKDKLTSTEDSKESLIDTKIEKSNSDDEVIAIVKDDSSQSNITIGLF